MDTTPGPDRTPAPRPRDPLARAFQILSIMVESDDESFGVRQLASRLSVSASTAHRLLNDLEKLGLIARTADANYQVGHEFYRLAWAATARFPLRQAAREPLRDLARASGETAFLGVYDDLHHQMMFATCVESRHPLRYVVELNRWMPLHAGASGHAILAHLPPAVRAEITSADRLEPITDATITDPQQLDASLAEVRKHGYAMSRGQRIPGALAIAAPVFGPHGGVVGDIGITMPDGRFDPTQEATLATQVVTAAATATTRVGGTTPEHTP
ncbi:IclR family transcriptional regulator [Phytoactinopolyspora limicola]|uniref:IclR family transcriptional regulator n=1 Tax=Phytoactinopolyspora limicola TaxID=2715536 RepID=UPI001407DFCB|nr:IclR family transcriptional regulator [Phytoactinopolyspora limicola]